MPDTFTPDQLRQDLAGYLARTDDLKRDCESEVVTWRWGTDRMLCPLPYFEQVERGARGATDWRLSDRRWVESPGETKDAVRHGLDARGRLRMFEQGSLHVLINHSRWIDEITFYARSNESLTRYVVSEGRLLVCYHARRTDCCEETFVWEEGRLVRSIERMWIEEDGVLTESEYSEVLQYQTDGAGLLQEVRCETVKEGRVVQAETVFRRSRSRLRKR